MKYTGVLDFKDMLMLYRNMDVTEDLFDSNKVSGSYTINESLSCGTPIVVFDHNAFLSKHIYNTLLSKTIKGISEHLIFLSKNPEKVKRLSNNARKSVLKYSVENPENKLNFFRLLGKTN